MKTTTWETNCKRCNERVYYHPSKLLLESKESTSVEMNTKIVSLTCCSDCKGTLDYEFPKEFKKIN